MILTRSQGGQEVHRDGLILLTALCISMSAHGPYTPSIMYIILLLQYDARVPSLHATMAHCVRPLKASVYSEHVSFDITSYTNRL
jgi:hypothetical protein